MRPAALAAIAAAALFPIAAFAQSAPAAPPAPAASAPAANAGGITREEYIHRAEERAGKRAASHFDHLDTNHDGILQQSEIDAWAAAHPSHRRATAKKPKAAPQ